MGSGAGGIFCVANVVVVVLVVVFVFVGAQRRRRSHGGGTAVDFRGAAAAAAAAAAARHTGAHICGWRMEMTSGTSCGGRGKKGHVLPARK